MKIFSGDLGATRQNLLFTCVYAIVVGWFLYHHVMWRDEAQEFLILHASHSLSELWANLRYESHPLLWYLILWPFALTGDIEWLKIPQYAIDVVTMFVALRVLGRSWFERALLISGYFFAYEYALIVRPYMLATLCALIAYDCIAKDRLVRAALMAALAANIHLLFLAMAAAIALWATLKKLEEKGAGFVRDRDWLMAAAIIACGTVLTVAQCWPPRDSTIYEYLRFEPLRVIIIIWMSFFPIQPELVAGVSRVESIMVFLTSGLMLWLSYFFWRSRWQAGAVFLLIVLCVAIFDFTVPFLMTRYAGPITLGTMLIFASLRAGSGFRSEGWNQTCMATFVIVLALQSICAALSLAHAVEHPFSNSRNAAETVRAYCPSCVVVVQRTDNGSGLSAYLGDKPVFGVSCDEFGTFMRWDGRCLHRYFTEDVVAAARRFDNPVMVFNAPPSAADAIIYRLEAIKLFAGAVMGGENFYIYRFADAPSMVK